MEVHVDVERIQRESYKPVECPANQHSRSARQSTRDDSRQMDSEWVHDKFEDAGSYGGRSRGSRQRSPGPSASDARGTKVKVDNLHYELTQEDLEGLFGKIGHVLKVELLYDRAGRSEGTAYVTYNRSDDAREAIREFDGANAKGQPIRLSIMPSAPRRNPFDSAYMPGRSLADRITAPAGRSRSLSPNRYSNRDRDVDRYVPAGRSGGRSRSPMRRNRRGGDGRAGADRGRRPGARREAREKEDRDGGDRKARGGRPKKTAEELDAEMADYFGPGEAPHAASAPADGAPAHDAAALDDIDMIE
ncbi:hypothetical protein PG985_006538 [Apiospora marii]|uniref:uncharacterized protein n=1 Tax=Apiospora marii TaxID=335849 RepID=UPI003131FC83